MLVSITFPGTLGDEAPKANAGKFKDWGFEGQMNYRGNIVGVDYHIGGTFTFARNELVDYGGTTVLKSGYTTTQQGYALNSIFGLRYGGKIQNEEQLKAYLAKYYENNGINMPSNLRVGDNMYCDENGDGLLNEKDYIYLGSDTPEISYSFNAGVSYKGFDLNVIFKVLPIVLFTVVLITGQCLSEQITLIQLHLLSEMYGVLIIQVHIMHHILMILILIIITIRLLH